MKHFILKSLILVSVLISYFTVNFFINTYFINKNKPHVKGTTVIMGDSHTMTSLDPEKFNSADNISQTAEPYFVTYFKLKQILKYKRVDTVLLGFSLILGLNIHVDNNWYTN